MQRGANVVRSCASGLLTLRQLVAGRHLRVMVCLSSMPIGQIYHAEPGFPKRADYSETRAAEVYRKNLATAKDHS